MRSRDPGRRHATAPRFGVGPGAAAGGRRRGTHPACAIACPCCSARCIFIARPAARMLQLIPAPASGAGAGWIG